MNAHDSAFDDLCWALGWSVHAMVGTIWGYFDESGEHAPDGTLRRFTIGGGVATRDQWKALEPLWNGVLRGAGIDFFHMADFEARKGPYRDWDNTKRRSVLGDLLEIATDHVPHYFGVNDLPRDIVAKGQFRSAYLSDFAKLVIELERIFEDDEIKLVFAKHKDISPTVIGGWFERLDQYTRNRVKSGGFGSPENMPQLQVADIVAYELSRTSREQRPMTERYPLRFLASRAKSFTLLNATHLGLDRPMEGASGAVNRPKY